MWLKRSLTCEGLPLARAARSPAPLSIPPPLPRPQNFPGYDAPVAGPAMMAQIRGQAERFGATVVERDCAALPDLAAGPPFRVVGAGGAGETVTADSLIIATGAEARAERRRAARARRAGSGVAARSGSG